MNNSTKSEYIDQCLTMEDIVGYYCSPKKKYQSRIPCPLHGGTHTNFKMDKHTYFCFTCGAKGNAIQFVQALFNLDYKDAIERINLDFNLGMNNNINKEQMAKIDAKILEMKQEKERIKKMCEEWQEEYNDICDEIKGFWKYEHLYDPSEWVECISIIAPLMGKLDALNYLLSETKVRY